MQSKYDIYYKDNNQCSFFGEPKQEIINMLDELAKDNDGKKTILDIASGDGRHIIPAAERGFIIIGVEKNKQGIEITRKRLEQLGKFAELINCDMLDFNIERNHYDGIIFSDAIHFICNLNVLKEYIKKIQRGTKNNGQNIIRFLTEVKLDNKPYKDRINISTEDAQALLENAYTDWEISFLPKVIVNKDIQERDDDGVFRTHKYHAVRITMIAKKIELNS